MNTEETANRNGIYQSADFEKQGRKLKCIYAFSNREDMIDHKNGYT